MHNQLAGVEIEKAEDHMSKRAQPIVLGQLGSEVADPLLRGALGLECLLQLVLEARLRVDEQLQVCTTGGLRGSTWAGLFAEQGCLPIRQAARRGMALCRSMRPATIIELHTLRRFEVT